MAQSTSTACPLLWLRVITAPLVQGLCGRQLLVLLLLSLNLYAFAVEVRAPAEDRWQPVQTQLNEGNDQAALPLLTAIVADFPEWGHGWLKRAEVQERLGNLAAALEDAQKGHALVPDDAVYASTVARLLVRLDRFQEAIDLYRTFVPRKDPQGWVHYYAAEAAFQLGNSDEASTFLRGALNNSGSEVPAEFRFLDARILERAGDLSGSAAAFRRGLRDIPEHASQWFNLGIIYRGLAADGDPDAAQNAVDCFSRSVRLAPADPYAWFALGQSYVDVQDFVPAESNLRQALDRFQAAGISQGMELALTHGSYGLAHLRLAERGNIAGSYAEALTHLRQAEQLGLSDAPLYNNMLAAAIGAQREASTDGEREQHTRTAESIIQGPGGAFLSPAILGINYYQSGLSHAQDNPAVAHREALLAVEMLERAAQTDDQDQAAVLRFQGHAHALAADTAHALSQSATDDDNAAATDWTAIIEQQLDAGRDAYAAAAALGDGVAQLHYLARESSRSPRHAYAAGWRFLGWRSYIHPKGWTTVIANYGLAEGWRSPISIAVWTILLLICLILGLKGFFLPPKVTAVNERRSSSGTDRQRRPEPRPQPKTGQAAAAQRKPATRPAAPPIRDNRTTQDASPPRQAAPTRRAVDDIARRMAARQGQSGEQKPATRPSPRRRP